jgi:hypothetical protein
MADIDSLDVRVSKLEKGSWLTALLQFLIYPVLLALMGNFFSHQIETSKLETQKIQIAQAMVPILFSGNHSQALATEKLLSQVVDPQLAAQLNQITEDFYKSDLNSKIKSGDLQGAEKIVSAAQMVNSPISTSIIAAAKQDEAAYKKIQNVQLAAQKERQGFEALLSGNDDDAVADFRASDAAYPTYHQVFELARLLTSHKKELGDPVGRQAIFKTILDHYSYGMPDDIRSELAKRPS